jgi:hypothetical protein
MNLAEMSGGPTPQCYVCRFSKNWIVLWPQEPVIRPERTNDEDIQDYASNRLPKNPEWSMGSWRCYVNCHERVKNTRSGHQELQVCGAHWYNLLNDWIFIARQEVELDALWYAYLERTGQ